MAGKLWNFNLRLRHTASRPEESLPPSEYDDWIDCVLTQKSLTVCENSTNVSITQGEDFLFNETYFSNKTSLEYDEMVMQVYRIVLPTWITMCIISFFFNITVVLSVRWMKKCLSPTLCLSISLAMSDAYASLVLGAGFVVNSLFPIVYKINLGLYNDCYALILESFRLAGVVVAAFHLLALAINHYIGILRPLHYAAIFTKKTVFLTIGVMWFSPNVFFFAYFSLVPENGFQAPYCSKYDFILKIPFRATLSVLFFLPMIAMSIMYIHMFVEVRRRQKGTVQLDSSHQFHKSVKAIITTLFILGTYLLGWIPAVLYFILTCLDCPVPFTQITLGVRVPVGIFINSMIVLKCFVDPIIYAARMPEVKRALKSVYKTRCGFVEDEQDHSRHYQS